MSFLPPGDLLMVQRAINDSLPTTATNSRTSVAVDCRVDDSRRDEHLSGLPPFIRLRRWHIVMPVGTDVKAGDILTVPAKGAYYVQDTGSPVDDAVSTDAYCVLMHDASGALPLLTTDTVTFTQRSTNHTISNVGVTIVPVSPEAAVNAGGFTFTYEVLFDAGLRYTGDATTSPIAEGDSITWFRLKNGTTRLRYPQYWSFPFPFGRAYFADS